MDRNKLIPVFRPLRNKRRIKSTEKQNHANLSWGPKIATAVIDGMKGSSEFEKTVKSCLMKLPNECLKEAVVMFKS